MSRTHSLRKSGVPKSDEKAPEIRRESNQTPEQQKAEINSLVRRISELVEKKQDKAAIVLTNWLKDQRLPSKKK